MIFKRNDALNQKVFFWLLANKIIILVNKAQYQTQSVERTKIKQHPQTAKAFSSPEYIYKKVEHPGKLNSMGVKVDKLKYS